MTPRVSRTFIKVASEACVGDNLLPMMRRTTNHRGNVGVGKFTALAWERAGWVTTCRDAVSQARPLTGVFLTEAGFRAIVARLRELQGAA